MGTSRGPRKWGAAAAAACMAAGVLAGCGAGGPTQKAVIARGNAICETALRDARAVPAPASTGTIELRALVGYLAKIQVIVNHEVAQLEALPRPGADATTLDQYLAAMRAARTEFGQLLAAARAGDQAKAVRIQAELSASPATGLARRYGLIQCSGSGATVGSG